MDLSRLVGVAPSTISRVLNNRDRVAEETRKKVFDIIQATGYKFSHSASALAKQRQDTIGLLHELETEQEYLNYYGAMFIQMVSMAMFEEGFRLAITSLPRDATVDEIQQHSFARAISFDGLIIDHHHIRGGLGRLLDSFGVPTILVNPQELYESNAVLLDDVKVGKKATGHLIEHGHRRIGFIQTFGHYRPMTVRHHSEEDRYQGYLRAMNDADLSAFRKFDDFVDPTRDDENTCVGHFHRWIQKEKITAVSVQTTRAACRVENACIRLGLRVPQDISMIACDFMPTAEYALVPITCCRFNRETMARVATKMILELVREGKEIIPSRYVDSDMVPGESIAPPGEKG